MPLSTTKGFKFLFPFGTKSRAGADLLVEALIRAFSLADDVALVIVDVVNEQEPTEALRLDWLSQRLAADSSPDVELITEPLALADCDGLFASCDALVYPWVGPPHLPLLEKARTLGLTVVLPEDAVNLGIATHDSAYLVPSRNTPVTSEGSITKVQSQDLAGVLRRVVAEPQCRQAKAILAKAGQDQPRSSPVPKPLSSMSPAPIPSIAPPDLFRRHGLTWGGVALCYSGYAKVSRDLLTELVDKNANFGWLSLREEREFLDELRENSAVQELWQRITERRSTKDIFVCYHPPMPTNRDGLYDYYRTKSPEFQKFVGCTMFETDRLPAGWAEQCNLADEVWVPSSFNIETFKKAGVEPHRLKILPFGINARPYMEETAVYNVPGRKAFNFLSIFDWTPRKGWDVLLEAYLRTFTQEDDVSLTIRTYPAIKGQAPIVQQINDFILARGFDKNKIAEIILIPDFVKEKEMPSLYRAADAYVMPTRGEGFGLPFIEAMATGLPTIGTNWSAHVDFMNAANSYLIDIDGLVNVPEDMTKLSYFYTSDQKWAQPSVSHLGELMRHVVDHPQEARAKGRQAQLDISTRWNIDRMATALFELAQDIMAPKQADEVTVEAPNQLTQEEHPNVAWCGPIWDPSGYADEARTFLLGLNAAKVPLWSFPIKWSDRRAEIAPKAANQLQDIENGKFIAGRKTIVVQHALGSMIKAQEKDYLCVGRTMFETDSLPKEWVDNCNTMDEVWVPSDFNLRTFANAGVDPSKLKKVPGAIDASRFQNIGPAFDIGTDKTTKFLSVFDWSLRKGWPELLQAFLSEFQANDDVALVLKVWSSSGKTMPMIEAEILAFVDNELGLDPANMADIVLLDREIAEADMPQLYASADAYVQPTHGEGWGRPIMEAMACGTPTIATGWGGNTEYMTKKNSCLIEYKLEPCSTDASREAPWFNGHNWARPFVPHLRQLLRRVVEDPLSMQTLGKRGRQDILAKYDQASVSKIIIDRLQALATRPS